MIENSTFTNITKLPYTTLILPLKLVPRCQSHNLLQKIEKFFLDNAFVEISLRLPLDVTNELLSNVAPPFV